MKASENIMLTSQNLIRDISKYLCVDCVASTEDTSLQISEIVFRLVKTYWRYPELNFLRVPIYNCRYLYNSDKSKYNYDSSKYNYVKYSQIILLGYMPIPPAMKRLWLLM